jgi:hypothetical protein
VGDRYWHGVLLHGAISLLLQAPWWSALCRSVYDRCEWNQPQGICERPQATLALRLCVWCQCGTRLLRQLLPSWLRSGQTTSLLTSVTEKLFRPACVRGGIAQAASLRDNEQLEARPITQESPKLRAELSATAELRDASAQWNDKPGCCALKSSWEARCGPSEMCGAVARSRVVAVVGAGLL